MYAYRIIPYNFYLETRNNMKQSYQLLISVFGGNEPRCARQILESEWIFGKETCVPPVPQANFLVDQHVHSERFTRQLRLSVLRSYSCQTLMPPCSCKACPSSTNKVVSAFWVLQWASELVKAWLVVGFGVLESWKLPKSPSQGTCLDGLEIQTKPKPMI